MNMQSGGEKTLTKPCVCCVGPQFSALSGAV